MFVGEARSLPWSGLPERGFTWVGSSLTRKHLTRLEKLARDKQVVTYGSKKFYNIDHNSQSLQQI
jgi:hypothetical protein